MPITKIDKDKFKRKIKGNENVYRVRVNYTDRNGNHKQVERTVYGYEEAKDVERQLEQEYKDQGVTLPSKMTVSQLINEYEKYHSRKCKKGAHDTTMRTLRLRVEPYLGETSLNKLNMETLNNWLEKIDEQKLTKGNKDENISQRTKRNAYKTLMSLLNYAVKLKYIPNNPLKDTLEFTFNESKRSSTKKEMQFYTSEQFERFIEAAKNHCNTIEDWNYYVFFCILFFMGLRKGECYGLTWNDIEGNTMHIRRSVSQKIKDADGNDYVDTPKNHKIRDILIPQQLLDILNAHKERQQNAAPDQFNNNFKICGYGNKSIRDSSVDNRNRLYAKEAGLPHIRIHDFRHPYVKHTTKNNCDNLMKIFACTEPIRRTSAKGTQSQSCCRGKRTPALSASPQVI